MADVFISYKSERRAAAEHLAEILADYGYSVWWDYGLVSGQDFGAQIEKQLRAAKAVVVLWCSLSTQSEWVREEASLAKRQNKVIPTFIEMVDLPLGFSLSQTFDLSRWDGAPKSDKLDRLLRDIGRLVGRSPKPNMEGLERTERAWRRFGAPSLREFALIDSLERKLPPRTLPGALSRGGGSDNNERRSGGGGLVIGLVALVALAGAGFAAWSYINRPALPGAQTATIAASTNAAAVEAARSLAGQWRREGDSGCTTLAVSGAQLSFTGPGVQPYAEDIVGFDSEGAVHTDVGGTPALYRKENGALLFSYGNGAPLRYEPCAH